MMDHFGDAVLLDSLEVHQRTGFLQFPQNEFEPQLKGLVDDDEMKFIVGRRGRIPLWPILQ